MVERDKMEVVENSNIAIADDEGEDATSDDCGGRDNMLGAGGDGAALSDTTGNKFQTVKTILKLLPYYGSLKKETESILEKTIRNLGIAVLRQDFQEGVVVSSKTLMMYIEMYGLKFSKEQHVSLIKLYLELLTMKTCPLTLIPTLTAMLSALLIMPKVLTRDDLTIPWRPLYETLDRFNCTLSLAMSRELRRRVLRIVWLCNKYLEKGTFPELVAELKPWLCPSSPRMPIAMIRLYYFIPYADPDAEEDVGKFLLELLEYYVVWNNQPGWEGNMMAVFAMTAWHMPRSLDWTPHLPMIYARLMRDLDLPVYFKGYCPPKSNDSVCWDVAATWIVSTLGNNRDSMFHLKNFLNSVETFFSPSNNGRWRARLGKLMDHLVNCFFERVDSERYKDNQPWYYRRLHSTHLTDEDIEDFIKMISNIVLKFYLDGNFCGPVISDLAIIRPQLIIPVVMKKYSEIVDTVTEHKKYMIVLKWVSSSLMSVLKSSNRKEEDVGYDGRHLVLPFVKSLLPAIDPNDMPKTLCALNRLTDFILLLPLVDCSAIADEAETEVEKELCRATAGLEELVLQILERVLSLIQCRTLEDTRMMDNGGQRNVFNDEDKSLEGVFWELFLGIANHASTKICQSVASKLAGVALTSTMETEVSGRLFAGIVQGFGVARPDVLLPLVLPQLCISIQNLVTDDMLDEEKLDPELNFQLLLLSRIVGTNGKELLKYRTQIESTLITAQKLNAKNAYLITSAVITNLLQSLVLIYPLESRISEANYDDPKYMAIIDWGAMMEAKSVKPSWHIPSDEELQWAKSLFLRIFTEYSTKFEVIDGCTEKQEGFNKRLLKYMNILIAAYIGINTLLKFWDETPMEPSLADLTVSNRHYCGIPEIEIVTPGTGENVTFKYYKLYCSLQTYLEKFKADDTDAFYVVMRGFYNLVVPNVTPQRRIQSTMITASVVNPKSMWNRGAIIKKTYDLHLSQVRMTTRLNWTLSHASVLQRVFQLCVNRYAQVRFNAQIIFFSMIDTNNLFAHLISRCIQPFLIEKLQEGVPHDEYKGALYLIWGWTTLLLKSRWQDISDLWIALIKSPFSEKKSIIKKMAEIQNLVLKIFIYSPLKQEVRKDSRLTQLVGELLSKEELERIGALGSIDVSANQEHYTKLVKTLIKVGSDGNSHWRKKQMASNMLRPLIFVDDNNHLMEELVTFYLNGLVSTISQLRESAMLSITRLLRFFKREYPILTIDVEKDLEFAPGESIHSILQYTTTPHLSNDTCKYKIKNQYSLSELYVHKTHYGFTAMPTNLTLKQPVTNFNDLSAQKESLQLLLKTTEIFFTDEDYVTKLMEFWSLEKQGVSSWCRVTFVKAIARNNGPNALRLLVQWASQFGVDKDKWKQRCAADVLSGIMRGLKLWDDEIVNEFWTELVRPVFTECLNNVTQETIGFWGTVVSWITYNRDPNKLRFFIQFLKERFIESLNTAQTTSVDTMTEMSFFNKAIWQLQWRGGEVYMDTLALTKKHFFDTPNPYMKVRLQLGILLAICMEWDVKFSLCSSDLCPKFEPFLKLVSQNLENLEDEAVNYQADVKDCDMNEEIRQLLLKFKTVLAWIKATLCITKARINPSVYTFIPLLCQFESFQSDPEVADMCGYVLATLSRAQIHSDDLDGLLGILRQAAKLPAWKARVCVLEFIKVFALNNISILASNDRWSEEVRSLVMELLSDRKVEVREAAYKIMSGLLHCLLIKEPMDLLSKFRSDATSLTTKRCENKSISSEHVDALHSSILGLCAFVCANQYQVPQYLPDVLIILTTHLNDPQPIPGSVRKCLLDFRHRHQDDWNKHKAMFTEDQLCILNDVFVSPNYYV